MESPELLRVRSALRSALRRLATALIADPGTEPFDGSCVHAINACLVLAGVRTAARLEHRMRDGRAGGPGPFWREVEAQCALAAAGAFGRRRRVGVRTYGGNGASQEPLVVNLDEASAEDLAALAGSDDMQEPLLSAMGNLLGYRCRLPDKRRSRASSYTVELLAHLQWYHHGDGKDMGDPPRMTRQVAAFMCGDGDEAARATQVLERAWSEPARALMQGAEFDGPEPGLVCVVAGFSVESKSKRKTGAPTNTRRSVGQ